MLLCRHVQVIILLSVIHFFKITEIFSNMAQFRKEKKNRGYLFQNKTNILSDSETYDVLKKDSIIP